jgi:hypothetical protein
MIALICKKEITIAVRSTQRVTCKPIARIHSDQTIVEDDGKEHLVINGRYYYETEFTNYDENGDPFTDYKYHHIEAFNRPISPVEAKQVFTALNLSFDDDADIIPNRIKMLKAGLPFVLGADLAAGNGLIVIGETISMDDFEEFNGHGNN